MKCHNGNRRKRLLLHSFPNLILLEREDEHLHPFFLGMHFKEGPYQRQPFQQQNELHQEAYVPKGSFSLPIMGNLMELLMGSHQMRSLAFVQFST